MLEEKRGFTAAAIQIKRHFAARPFVEFLERVEYLVAEAVSSGALLVVLPELFAEDYSDLDVLDDLRSFLSRLASCYGCWLVGGSLPTKVDSEDNPNNTLILYGPSGDILLRYNKRNLFYARFCDQVVDEFERFSAGMEMPVAYDAPFARLGFAICYDLRFPELFLAQRADIFVVPSSFRYQTGKDHWEVLLRARAIENQAFVIAANCSGKTGQSHFWGHSMIVDPWGVILSNSTDDEAVVTSFVDMEFLMALRYKLPMRR
ncbi:MULTISPECIES: nitrilase-related carbon-nitrogen hydrolase [Candidatus Ichthyocystis]|uniref:nitrilase-related carbon-nitrogen hydrolase n=1 Tax=Candidatus Ichthyocystis TaxID=2929841 RepID=UPI000B81C207|nr:MULTISPECIES: nitrilase-related carbon-nitrogen hydrolase [Ichthyocystis]